jgi:hypothetical protein
VRGAVRGARAAHHVVFSTLFPEHEEGRLLVTEKTASDLL